MFNLDVIVILEITTNKKVEKTKIGNNGVNPLGPVFHLIKLKKSIPKQHLCSKKPTYRLSLW